MENQDICEERKTFDETNKNENYQSPAEKIDDICVDTEDSQPMAKKCTDISESTELNEKKTRKILIFAICLFLILVALSTLCTIGIFYHNKVVAYDILSKMNANTTATLMRKEQEAKENERLYEALKMKYQQIHEALSEGSVTKANQNSRQCEEGWKSFGLKCYYFSTNKLNWARSRDKCVEKGGHLVIITSQTEQDFVSSQIRETHWIGLNDLETEGEWMWVNNQPLKNTSSSFWFAEGQSEPDNWTKWDPSGEDCGAMGDEKVYLNKWFDASCRKLKRFICENKILHVQF